MPNRITYRKATLEDCLAIATLKGIVWNTTYKGIYSEESLKNYDILRNQKIFENIIQNPYIELYVAICNEEIVGFMTYGKPFKPFMDFQQEIGMLYILQEYQRQGIGRTFLNIARQQTSQNGYNKFCVAVNKKNYSAQVFYCAMGGDTIDETDSQLHLCFRVTAPDRDVAKRN